MVKEIETNSRLFLLYLALPTLSPDWLILVDRTTNQAAALAKFLERKLKEPNGLASINPDLLELAVNNSKQTVFARSTSNPERSARHVDSFGDTYTEDSEDEKKELSQVKECKKRKKNKKKKEKNKNKKLKKVEDPGLVIVTKHKKNKFKF